MPACTCMQMISQLGESKKSAKPCVKGEHPKPCPSLEMSTGTCGMSLAHAFMCVLRSRNRKLRAAIGIQIPLIFYV